MAEISDDDLEELGQLADKADNFVHASKMRLPAHIHLEALGGGMKEIRDKLRALVVRLSDGENPWEGEPESPESGGAGGK